MRRTVALSVIALSLAFSAFAAAAEEKSPSYTFKFSGYFKGDLIYDQTRINSGNYALYVAAPDNLNAPKNDVMSITARESRFGLDLTWKENDVQTDARFEFDFYGLGVPPTTPPNAQENKPAPMLRHAYLQVTKGRWSLLAGQTSDIISPLVPKTVNYTVCWDQGNIGYRRPQFRISAWANANEKVKVSATAGVFRTLGGDLDGDKIDDGADAAIPTVEGRLGMAAKLGGKKAMELGVSGHYGREEYQAAGETRHVRSRSGNVDVKITFCECLELMGEAFVGENLGTYYGGVGQTVNLLKQEIGAKGGWAELSYKPMGRLSLNAGYSLDDPDEADFVLPDGTVGTKSFFDKNSNIFGSIMYDLTSNVTAMLEVSQLTTTYLYKAYIADKLKADSKDFGDLRVQFALKASIK